MSFQSCPNPDCQFKVIPRTALVCPVCGTSLEDVLQTEIQDSPPPDAIAAVQPTPVTPPTIQSTVAIGASLPMTPPTIESTVAIGANLPMTPPTFAEGGSKTIESTVVMGSPGPLPLPPRLKLVHPSGREFTWLPRTETLAGYIGRRALVGESLAEIELADIPHLEVVSRQHARIHWDATAQVYQITDEKSQNGTFLNGKPLTAGLPHPLHHEDWLQLGQHGLVRLQVQLAAH